MAWMPLWLAACGGGDAPGGAGANASDVVDSSQVQDLQMVREVFTYRGAGRDPFASLLESGTDLRPFLEDLRVTSIVFDARYPARSVVVLRDTTGTGERYVLRVGDVVGRLRVAEIREYQVLITVDEFGQPRQVVLALRRQGEAR